MEYLLKHMERKRIFENLAGVADLQWKFWKIVEAIDALGDKERKLLKFFEDIADCELEMKTMEVKEAREQAKIVNLARRKTRNYRRRALEEAKTISDLLQQFIGELNIRRTNGGDSEHMDRAMEQVQQKIKYLQTIELSLITAGTDEPADSRDSNCAAMWHQEFWASM